MNSHPAPAQPGQTAAPLSSAPAVAAPAVPVIDRWKTQLEIGSIRAASTDPWLVSGKITRATGLVLHATGLRLPVGAAARIEIARGHDHWADAEVVGFDGHTLYLMPQADISGLPPGARVVPGEPPVQRQIPLPRKAELNGNAKPQLGRHLPVGNALLGRVLDGAGRPLDGLGPLTGAELAPLSALPINPLSRAPIDTVLDTGVRAINGLLTVGRGQRMGLFAGSGATASTSSPTARKCRRCKARQSRPGSRTAAPISRLSPVTTADCRNLRGRARVQDAARPHDIADQLSRHRRHSDGRWADSARRPVDDRGRRSGVLALLAGLILASAPACASMQQRVTESENRSSTLAAQVADLQATQQEIITRLTQLREDLERQLDPARAQQGGGTDVRTMQAEIDNLREQVLILTDQLAALEQAGPGVAAGVSPPNTAMPPAGGERSTGGGTEAIGGTEESEQDTLFNAAYADYTAGEYVLAVSGFEEFVLRYPEAPRAADALYWTGESLAGQDLHREARQRFLDVAESYPSAPKVRDALLRAALEAVELGLLGEAVTELRELIAAHPRSDAALVGCMQLDRLGEPLPSGCQVP